MKKKKRIVRYTAKQLARMKGKSDWVRSAAMSETALKASIAADPDEADMDIDWGKAMVDMPQPKAVLNMRVDCDVLTFFKKAGRGYQTKINAILRSYVEHQRH